MTVTPLPAWKDLHICKEKLKLPAMYCSSELIQTPMAKPKLSYKKVDKKRATTVRIKIQVLNSYKCIRTTESNVTIQIRNTPKIMASLPGAPLAGSDLLGV